MSDDSIDRREALAGVSLIGVCGVVLVGSIVYRAIDASRAQGPAVSRKEISPLLTTNEPHVSGVDRLASESTPRGSDDELAAVEVDPFSTPDAELAAERIKDQRISPSAHERDDPPRRDVKIVGASHEQRSASPHRPRFVSPKGIRREDGSTPGVSP